MVAAKTLTGNLNETTQVDLDHPTEEMPPAELDTDLPTQLAPGNTSAMTPLPGSRGYAELHPWGDELQIQPTATATITEMEATDPLLGRNVHGFRIERLLGQGSAGRIYYANHRVLDRELAVKVLHGEL